MVTLRYTFQKGGTTMQKRSDDQKRADYYLYTWQIKAVQRISRETQTPPSEVMRSLLQEALAERRPTRDAIPS